MKNKVEVRAFAVEQVVKMRCMSDCSSEEIIREAKRIEEYVVGDVCIPEFGDETTDMMGMLKDLREKLVSKIEKDAPKYHVMGCGLG